MYIQKRQTNQLCLGFNPASSSDNSNPSNEGLWKSEETDGGIKTSVSYCLALASFPEVMARISSSSSLSP